ncbi:MAG: imidazoleglycerol-phosphate dehydratase HisB [Clostridia bacterium]|jgi:imidazoleglycerol-phosphate dehydratase|nr:imidazoleglycerol-phosphate dehydratase HisB [Clostridia bacterium]MBQ6092243.1 imidazoleglycerol-phosphate dehydratase HisB [Clostridia bacterium]
MRTANVNRTTGETEIRLGLNLDGTGRSDVQSGVGFLDHMLTLFAKHGRFDLVLQCRGDVEVDDHHSVEDIGIALGQAFREALGEKRGIVRYGFFLLPMDEALIQSAVDLSGRSYLGFSVPMPTQKVGTFDTELVEEFFLGFTRNLGCSLHIRSLAGSNTHHIIEGVFKCVARALKDAVSVDPALGNEIPSTKGVL